MHFAYPPRKSSNPPPYVPRTSRVPALRRSRLKVVAVAGLAILFLVWLFSSSSSSSSSRGSSASASEQQQAVSGKPPVVIVTVLEEKSASGKTAAYLEDVRLNRKVYAERHGYGTHLADVDEYLPDLDGAPKSWAKVVAARHALAKYPDCKYVWYIDQDAFIMNPGLTLEEHVLAAGRLEAVMIKDTPVVPPDSIITTFSHLKADDVNFVVTQDQYGLSAASFVVRNGEWAKFFLETWFDPLYRSYNFQRAETHALEHIVQWHPTILSKLAIVPQNMINAYAQKDVPKPYADGDLVVRLANCRGTGASSCATLAQPFQTKWHEVYDQT